MFRTRIVIPLLVDVSFLRKHHDVQIRSNSTGRFSFDLTVIDDGGGGGGVVVPIDQ